ncbi:Speckle-type POZ protein B like protein [Argiope bruennichi]|uniref:Speckle-type POZ protein B like protein n=1 Tax=Argiope bruennichi TaxID=94029 RepID=A0A8T0FGF0_ARGBR|nr:Speckle-type POZ protein B like protein [Argiope bruennichi]
MVTIPIFRLDTIELTKMKTPFHVVFNLQLVNSEGNVYIQKKVRFSHKASHKSIRFLKIKFADPDYFSSATKLTEGEIREPDDDILKNMVSHELVAWDKESVHMLYSLPGGSITIKGCVKVFACCVPLKTTPISQNSSENSSEETKQSELIDHLRYAFTDAIENGQFTDFSFHIQDEVVRAHKFILSARSPKFKTLLQPNSEGFSENEITIRDIEKKCFLHFLHYLYTGIVGVVKWDTVEKLYETAIKYEVNSLLEHCRRVMMSSLVDRRACRALLFANKHKDEELKKASINFIRDIFKKFKDTDFWISFRKDNPGLALEVVNCVVDNI